MRSRTALPRPSRCGLSCVSCRNGWSALAKHRLTLPKAPPRPPNGCWTTTIRSSGPFSRSRAICQPGSTPDCPAWPAATATGLPRVYALAHGLLRASRLQLSLEGVAGFVNAYQEVAPLTIAELWALPTMLRLAGLEILVASFARLFPDLTPPFEPSGQAAAPDAFEDTERASRALASLASIASIPWKDFFDRVSRVEATLRHDPAGFYAQMDFETRDRYRGELEDLAQGSGSIRNRYRPGGGRRVACVGRRTARLPCRPLAHRRRSGGVRSRDRLSGAFSRLAGALDATPRGASLCLGADSPRSLGAGRPRCLSGDVRRRAACVDARIALSLLPASILAVAVVHWIVTLSVRPRVLPKLSFDKGIPPQYATAVVMPVLVAKESEVPALIERLEMHRLANADPSLQFALLSDHADASGERMPGDESVEKALVEGIRQLNRQYGTSGSTPFHLLHRRRRYNDCQSCWMAWERKRGKLEQFNRFVLGDDVPDFSLHEGAPEALRGVRFVVTLDADTKVPHGAVARLVGTLAHPLNSARFDPATGRVATGYTVVQPRVEIAPESGIRSRFARLYTGDTAIDIYSQAVSDVYQDLFGSGIFIGKGIYEVAPFQRSIEGRIPENALVSHDLFEGLHGRAALATDIVLYEGFPVGYVEYARRWHRWVRGDWQLLPWLAGRVPGAAGTRLPNRLSALDRWKIFDNLRRSLVPIGLVALAAAGWLVLPGSPWIWTILTIAVPAVYLLTDLVSGLARGRRRGAVRSALRQLIDHLGRWSLAVVFLAQDAAVALDAISRTTWRLFSSRRNLLEWTSAAHTAARFAAGGSRLDAWRQMWPAPAVSIGLGTAVAFVNPAAFAPAAVLLLLWFASPEIAAFFSRPRPARQEPLDATERAFLRRVARRTWLYFETFVGPDDHWLPPDNYQEKPHEEIAHRTSPTNVGMMLLSTLSAWDLGYIGSSELSARLRNALDTLERLERHRGHLLNWYDTRSLEPLEPRYVSTVDSGNLAVCLIALRQGCIDAVHAPVMRGAQWDGLSDALALLSEALEDALDGEDPGRRDHMAMLARMSQRIARARDDIGARGTALTRLLETDYAELEAAITDSLSSHSEAPSKGLREVHVWLDRMHHQLVTMQRDLKALRPWNSLLETPPSDCAHLADLIAGALPLTASLGETTVGCRHAREVLAAHAPTANAAASQWVGAVDAALEQGSRLHTELQDSLRAVAARCESLAFAMDFQFLFDTEPRLFHIGHNVSADRIDQHHYDLLATEARLASYFAIAKGDVPVEHWFFLGRPMAQTATGPVLVSWNGSMFEYLMAPLLLRSHVGTLLGQSESAAVEVQRRYAERHRIPWGMSESGYASRDVEHRYRYQAFGVPHLGLRRGLERDLVVAPYASALAIAASPRVAVRNLLALERLGGFGRYGFLEALDFTDERREISRGFAPVNAYMAHHQGMALAAFSNALCDRILVRRFHADPRMRAVELLLHERVPWEFPPQIERFQERDAPAAQRETVPPPQPWAPKAADAFPQMHALGNGRFSTWITEAGSGGLQWHGQALTRWVPDATRDHHGLWIYVTDEDSGAVWSIGRQPTGVVADEAHVTFHPHMAEFHRHDHGVSIRMEVAVTADEDIEIRRITVVNQTDRPRSLRFTSLGEVVLAPSPDDERHPAFMKLFVGGTHLPALNGLLFERRCRHPGETPPVLLHRVLTDDPSIKMAAFDCDRASVLGRHGSLRRPSGVVEGLSGKAGWTLDPVMALQIKLDLAPRQSRQFAFLTIAAGSRESVIEIAERHATLGSLEWALADAASDVAREVRRLGLEPHQLPELQTLASLLMYPHPMLRSAPDKIAANRLGQPRLWSMGLSGDEPILLLRMDDGRDADFLQILVRAHQLWRRRGIKVDLVVLRTGSSGYVEPIRDQFLSMLREAGALEFLARRGGIHLIVADQLTTDDCQLLEVAARVVLDAKRGPLGQQLATAEDASTQTPPFRPGGTRVPEALAPALARPTDLLFDNGTGGFVADGREYLIHLKPGATTPAPWSNVLANDGFGTIVTEAGIGFTWAVNSGENRLTPWNNDPVADTPGEALYLRDEETAEMWTPTPLPAGRGVCQIRHGAGYTKWSGCSQGIEHELLVFVPVDDPVKVVRLRLHNLLPRARRVTATYYAEWLLGALPSRSRPFVVCEYDAACHALVARNPWNPDFSERVAFLTSTRAPHSLTTDRQDFLGREGDPASPAALGRWDLGGRTPPGADPCAAFQVHLEIAPEDTVEVVFVLGQGNDHAHVAELVRRWQDPEHVEDAFDRLNAQWERLLGAVRVRTPDPAFDVMVNRWLPYQAMSSRIRARAGFYQAGGAIGFRDQLQDVMAVFHMDPARARAHILASAARQFEEGDVLHWWHPPSDRGVRTRCSDDMLWLPYVTSRYVAATGDETVLHEEVPFLRAPPLAPEEHDRYARFDTTTEQFSLFEHCRRALEKGVTQGAHGLPLIGTGDWNDGMDRIGSRLRGESVWLAWFAISTMKGFADLAERLGRDDLCQYWRERVPDLQQSVEDAGWDGKWYKRAFDDDGRPWGSASNDECRIDLIAQSWAVLSGAAATKRADMAIRSATAELMRGDDRIIRLLWPPFDETPRDPGYIKAYPPGIRENGGQYTHAAAWLGFAFAELGDGDLAARVFEFVNPINHALTPTDMDRYRTEPYVVAADVGSVDPHRGRGGWSWYTGSAAWVWRLGVEQILGMRLLNGDLLIDPCLPKAWRTFEATIHGPAGNLEVRVEDPEGISRGVVEAVVDGTVITRPVVAFPTDGTVRNVKVRLGISRPEPKAGRETPAMS
jgi:cyclic beta-1,2-glucan synthetase